MSGADGAASDVVVSVVETATAVGLTAAQTAAAVRAGIAGFAELAEYSPVPAEIVDEDDGDEPAPLIAATHGLAHGDGAERLIDLTVEPLAAAIGAARISRAELARAGFYVALPYADPTIAGLSLERTFFPTLRERLGLPAVLDPIGTQSGAPGFFALLERAAQRIAGGELELCVLIASDSYLLAPRLEHYDEAWRLKTARNPSGFIPGEAAGVVIVEKRSRAVTRGAGLPLGVLAIGRGREPHPIEGSEGSTGTGLTAAIRAAHDSTGLEAPTRWVVSDLDGERYKAFEWGLALPRLGECLDPELVHWHPADCIGNVGSAAPVVHLACVQAAYSRGYAPAKRALLIGASDGGQRAAMLVGRIA